MSRKALLLAAVIGLLLCAGPYAQGKASRKKSPARTAARTSVRPLRTGEEAILKTLEQRASFPPGKATLDGLVALLREKHRVAARLDRRAIEDEAVGDNAELSLDVPDVPLRSALELILRDVGLTWMIENDVLLITSTMRAESDESLVVRVYDLSDLVVDAGDRPYRGKGLPGTASEGVPWPPGRTGMGRMGLGFFSVPPQSAPNAAAASAREPLATIISCIPVVGAAAADDEKVRGPLDAMPQMGGPACCGPCLPVANLDSDDADRMTEISDLITSAIRPQSWDSSGGPGTASCFDHLLVVKQTHQVHRAVADCLAELRAKRQATPTLVVDLLWLWLDQRQYEELAGGKRAVPGRIDLAMDAKALERLATAAGGFRGRIVCQNGQLAYLASGDRHSAVTGATPVVGSGGVGYQPAIQVPNAGAVLELRPALAPGAETAVLDVRSTVARWDQGKPPPGAARRPARGAKRAARPDERREPLPQPGGTAACPVDRPVMPAQQFAATVRVPLGKPVVLGAMTFAPTAGAGLAESPANPRQLYLIATTSVASFEREGIDRDPAATREPRADDVFK